MPHYTYRCLKCGKQLEVFQNMSAPKLTHHRNCGGKLQRLIGAGAGIIFKDGGCGWSKEGYSGYPKKK